MPPEAATALTPEAMTIKEIMSYWPTVAWRTSTPEEQGMDSDRLREMMAFIDEQDFNLRGLLIQSLFRDQVGQSSALSGRIHPDQLSNQI